MKDNYPTRIGEKGMFMNRLEPVVYSDAAMSLEKTTFYKENGYVILRNVLYDLSDCIQESTSLFNNQSYGLTVNEPELNIPRSITGIHEHEPFNTLSRNSFITNIAKSILGSKIYIHQSRINYKATMGANGWHWHSDFETWHSQDGMPQMRCLTAMIPLTKNTECNGSLMVIPKSHKVFYSCRKEKQVSAEENFADQKEGVPDKEALLEFFKEQPKLITCDKGDVVLFDCNIIHGSIPNMTPFPRTNLFFVYNSIENKLVNPFSCEVPRPEQMGARQIAELC